MSTAITVHSLSFHDHDGNTSVMVFWASTDQPLPPLYSFAIYATSPENTSPESLGVVKLLQALNTSRYAPETTSYRLDIYFQPGASIKECERHYNAEKAARGTYINQLKEIRDGRDKPGELKIHSETFTYSLLYKKISITYKIIIIITL